jgi:hypothetical protein
MTTEHAITPLPSTPGTYRGKRARGLCGGCGLVPTGKVAFCDGCRPGVRAANNKTRNDRKAKGLCPLCGERKPEEGKVNCRICLDKRAASVGKGHHRLKLDIGPGGELIVDTSVDVLGANEEPARLTLRSHTRIEALNVLWLRAGSFTLKPSQAAALAKVLSDYAQTHKDDGSEETQDDDEDHG